MIERKADRRRSVSSHFTSPASDRRRPSFERRGTVRRAPPTTREVLVHGERRVLPDAGLE